jgi:hypothetical protein
VFEFTVPSVGSPKLARIGIMQVLNARKAKRQQRRRKAAKRYYVVRLSGAAQFTEIERLPPTT